MCAAKYLAEHGGSKLDDSEYLEVLAAHAEKRKHCSGGDDLHSRVQESLAHRGERLAELEDQMNEMEDGLKEFQRHSEELLLREGGTRSEAPKPSSGKRKKKKKRRGGHRHSSDSGTADAPSSSGMLAGKPSSRSLPRDFKPDRQRPQVVDEESVQPGRMDYRHGDSCRSRGSETGAGTETTPLVPVAKPSSPGLCSGCLIL